MTLDNITLLQGHVLDVLATLPDESVHSVVTSPPYLGLRDYKLPPQVWTAIKYVPMPGLSLAVIAFPGDPACEHEWLASSTALDGHRNKDWDTKRGNAWKGGKPNGGHKPSQLAPGEEQSVRSDTCLKCGAWRGHLGNEPSLEMYVAHLVQIFREVRRVLRSDGIFWLNLGDAHARNAGKGIKREAKPGGKSYLINQSAVEQLRGMDKPEQLQEGELLGVPWRVAFALQADGWLLHSDPIWIKQTWMPESISGPHWEQHKIKTEQGRVVCPGCEKCLPNGGLVIRNGSWRPTRAHETIFMFTKTSHYFGDGQPVRQEAAASSLQRIGQKNFANQTGGDKDYGATDTNANRSARKALENFALNPGHNLTTVWKLKPGMFDGKHFAVFPPSLPEMCIKASVSEGGVCSKCGKPYLRIVNRVRLSRYDLDPADPNYRPAHYDGKEFKGETDGAQAFSGVEEQGFKQACECVPDDHTGETASACPEDSNAKRLAKKRQFDRKQGRTGLHGSRAVDQDQQSSFYRIKVNTDQNRAAGGDHENPFLQKDTVGFKQSCECHELKPVPATVLDPFSGAGTTLLVCARLGLKGIGIELNPEYVDLSWKRLTAPRKKKVRPQKLSDGEQAGQLSLGDLS